MPEGSAFRPEKQSGRILREKGFCSAPQAFKIPAGTGQSLKARGCLVRERFGMLMRAAVLAAIVAFLPHAAFAAEPAPRDWGVQIFPAMEKYGFIRFYTMWQSEFAAAVDAAAAAGMRRALIAKRWSEIEPRAGKIKTDDIAREAALYRAKNIDIFFGLQLINTVKAELPEDLSGKAWDSPEVTSRALAAIDKTLALLPQDRPVYFSFGNEVDVYFEKAPQELDAFLRLYAAVRAHIAARYPHVRTGITTTYDGYLHGRKAMIAQIQAATDIVIFTYYPLDGFKVRPPDAPLRDIPEMVKAASPRPLVLQEAGYPSAARIGSSEDMQADFVRHLFAAWDAAAADILHVSVFMQTDFTRKICEDLTAYYGLSAPAYKDDFMAMLCTLGLRTADGREKPAWAALREVAGR